MGHDVHYLIAGEGDDQPRLEALALERGVRDRVHFLGPVPLRNLPDLYRAADLYVMASHGEGFGIAFLEAMVSGTQALGLDIAGAKDVLANGELGFCVPDSDLISAFHQALISPKPDPKTVACAAQSRFGREKFEAGVRSTLNRLQQTA
jgi:phosphatidylinositol alpha-1,6-mannosyltransferase